MAPNSKLPFSSGVIPIPNTLVDEVLPTLKDTELRVLLVVLRQTVGWREGDDLGGWRFKERDWISHSQLVRRTGRRGEAVSMAIDALVRHGHIVVEDQAGRLLLTSSERRRHLGRLYFRPGDMWKTADECRPAKAKTTTYNRNYIDRRERKNKGRSCNEIGITSWSGQCMTRVNETDATMALRQAGWHRACDGAPVPRPLDGR